MRSVFPAYFRPTADDLSRLWTSCTFAVDANVLLNLYRYSPDTRSELESALKAVEEQLFVPHQAAREFLKNRLSVTASQAEEYTKAAKLITDLASNLSDKKKHPFLPPTELPNFQQQVERLKELLEQQRKSLLDRMTKDEILDLIENLFDGRTGNAFDEATMNSLVIEGERRYASETPPGYKDSKKDASGDPNRKFGDLIVWKQLIAKAKADQRPLIFITDDKKDDWWLEQSGRTIGPRTELREEFIAEVDREFWMYTVDLFVEEAARLKNKSVSRQVLDEIKTVREEVQAERLVETRRYTPFQVITPQEMLVRIANSERWATTNAEGFVGLHSFVKNHLGAAGYDYAASYDMVDQLAAEGLIEIYDHQGPGHSRPISAIKLVQKSEFANRPFEGLEELLKSGDSTS